MLHTFKKKGDFDSLRKKAFQQYNESAERGMFEAKLRKFTTDEIEREPLKYLRPDRRLAAPLLEGSAARAEVYEKSQADVDAYIEQFMTTAEETLRDIRRKEIGDVAAAEEQARGSKTEEEYAVEVEARRKERAKKHEEAEKARLKEEAKERKKKELEALKKKQEELMKETARLHLDQARRLQREEHKKAEKERERERIAKFNEEREKQKKEAEEREKALQAEREKRLQAEREVARKREKERLEQEALQILLSEGKAMSDRARRPGLERSESMEPPPRLLRHAAPHSQSSKDEMRARGLMPTSLTLRKSDTSSSIPTGPRSDRERVPDERTRADDDIRRRNSRLRSPSAGRRASAAYPSDHRRREDSRDRDYYRESARRDRDRERDPYYRGSDRARGDSRPYESESRVRRVSEAPRDQLPPPPPPPPKVKEEEGEVIERDTAAAAARASVSVRPRSRSRESHRRRESPPRRSYRERTRSPRRSSYREAPGRRDRSRSPAGIDRYVPGGELLGRLRGGTAVVIARGTRRSGGSLIVTFLGVRGRGVGVEPLSGEGLKGFKLANRLVPKLPHRAHGGWWHGTVGGVSVVVLYLCYEPF